MGSRQGPLLVRFCAKLQREPVFGCWLWTGSLDLKGYGRIRPNPGASMTSPHRVSYELFVGPIPGDTEIDHLCRVRHCVNPDHLEAVTHQENVRRGNVMLNNAQRHKTTCPRGHEYDVVVRLANGNSKRRCSTCHAAIQRAYTARNRKTT
jgi:hypothetical protein